MGVIITIDGLDGSGKATQASKLKQWLEMEGVQTKLISFPDYSSDSSALVKMYLKGDFGKDPFEVNPYAASTFYAIDRYAQYKLDWESYYNNGGIIIADRYISANIIHQGCKLPKERRLDFYKWVYNYEVGKLGLPKETLTILLEVEPEVSMQLIRERNRGNSNNDIHETNLEYLEACYENAIYAADNLGWRRINCVDGGKMRSTDDILDSIKKILRTVSGIL